MWRSCECILSGCSLLEAADCVAVLECALMKSEIRQAVEHCQRIAAWPRLPISTWYLQLICGASVCEFSSQSQFFTWLLYTVTLLQSYNVPLSTVQVVVAVFNDCGTLTFHSEKQPHDFFA